MKRLLILAVVGSAFSCQTPESGFCGEGQELEANGTTVCLYRAALIEEGFLCPPEASVSIELEDGGVLCSEDEILPEEIAQQLEAQGHEGPVGGTPWVVENSAHDADGLNNTPDGPMRWVLGTLVELDQAEPQDLDQAESLEKARVCVMDAEPESCTMTDAQGQFALPIMAGVEFALTAELDGYYPTILPTPPVAATQPAGSPNLRLIGWSMTPVDTETAMLASAGVTQEPTLGLLSVAIDGQGVIATVEPGTDEGWYPDGSTLSRSATGTTIEFGEVRFPNLAPGEYTVSATSDALGCTASGWPGATENTIRVPIRAGWMTSPVTIICN